MAPLPAPQDARFRAFLAFCENPDVVPLEVGGIFICRKGENYEATRADGTLLFSGSRKEAVSFRAREIYPELVPTVVAGGRDYYLSAEDVEFLDALPIGEVVSGGAKGADTCGEHWAVSRGVPFRRFPADWERFQSNAGPIRNDEMAKHAKAVVLFPGNAGTNNMFRVAKLRGLVIFDRRG